jgi:hypothetical protein
MTCRSCYTIGNSVTSLRAALVINARSRLASISNVLIPNIISFVLKSQRGYGDHCLALSNDNPAAI